MTEQDDEVLSAEFVFSTQEILSEFQARCEQAAMKPGVALPELTEAVTALCRLLDRMVAADSESSEP